MKRVVILFVLAGLVIAGILLWFLNARMKLGLQEVLVIAVLTLIIGFALFMGIGRMKSIVQKEPPKDELSKKIMTKSSSLSYYGSLYMWLIIMYLSDKTSLETHSLIGVGILAMALIFFFSWLSVKLIGLKND
jgi:peptidoglycan/LPS O-acetylase OafA/YrhL